MLIVFSERHRLHRTDDVVCEDHPFVTEEVPARAEIILNAVRQARLGTVIDPVDHGLEPILAVHDPDYLQFLQDVYAQSAAHYGQARPVFTWTFATRHNGRRPNSFLGLLGYYAFGWGTPILEGTWEAAHWSAQTAVSAARALRRGESCTYAVCRPPGHHAAADLYGGFCYLNNAAIAARYLARDGHRVAILDVDYHHGNGTQAVFYRDPAVLFCSLHAHPDEDYPYYWGDVDERGAGPGLGTNYNWPLPLDTDDARYLIALQAALDVIGEFAPQFLVVSVGFDIVGGDPVGSFNVTTNGVGEIGARVAGLGLPTVIVQEGGYVLDRLAENVIAFLAPFAEER